MAYQEGQRHSAIIAFRHFAIGNMLQVTKDDDDDDDEEEEEEVRNYTSNRATNVFARDRILRRE